MAAWCVQDHEARTWTMFSVNKPALSPLQCVIPRSHFSWFRTLGSLDHALSSVHNYHCHRHHPPTHHHHPPHITIVISITMNLLLLIRRNLFQVSVTTCSSVHEGKPWWLIASLSDSNYQHVRKSVLNHPFPCSLCGYPNPVPRGLKKWGWCPMKITNTIGISMHPQYVYFNYLRLQTKPLPNSVA